MQVTVLAAHPERLQLGGETRPMTIMFCDVRGFTAISEAFKSNPPALTKLINRLLTPMSDIIMAHRGTIDKYMGDCIMAFWNAPLDDPDHADDACAAALAMLDELERLNRDLGAEAAAEGRPFQRLDVGIGINSGDCVVGNMGSTRRFDYTVLGDAVNLASRLEGLSKTYGVGIVIGEATREAAPSWAALELDQVAVKGKREAIRIYGLLGDRQLALTQAFAALSDRHAAMLAAYLTEKGDDRIGSITLLNTLLDYSQPGVLGTFTDEKTVARLEKQMAAKGVLEGSDMAGTFDILRANDLIFNYVVSNWLMGQDPPAFDILAWNGDSTRMPAAMHSFYLRSLYMRNELARGDLELAGQRLSLASVKNDTYVVGAINDHIVPWHGSFKTLGLLGGTVRYVLSSGGHIAGIVNPPGPKAWYETGEDTTTDPETWRSAGTKHSGSWWQDWTEWSDARAGAHIKPPAMGSRRYPALGDAPGDYVKG